MATAVSTPADIPDTHEEDVSQTVCLDPALILRDEQNAREHDTEPDQELIASVKEIGVQDPISVRPLPDGTYGAFKGWRRTQAQQIANTTAEEDGRPFRRIKAYVRDDLVGQDGWTRFLSLVENKHREGMSERDILRSQELSLIDMSDVERHKAAKALGVGRDAATHAKAAQRLDDAALRRVAAAGMDLEQTAQLAEVESVTGAERRLLTALQRDQEEGQGGRGHWDQELALLRAEQDHLAERKQVLQELEEEKIPVLRAASWGEKDPSTPLSQLTTGLGNPLTEENHRRCPSHSARLDEENRPVWYCAYPAEHGHKVRPRPKQPRTQEDEKRAEERRKVITCNRAWKAAVGPRREFVTRLVRMRALPDAARVFAQNVLLTLPCFYSSWTDKHEFETVARFLGAKQPQNADPAQTAAQLPKTRVVNALFAHVAAACEYDLREPKTWSHLTARQARYLLLLESLGQSDNGSYRLSEVESQAVSSHRPDAAA
ncbi:ParB/RepB/Spo0J family partition protein [Streptomyces sp. NPDC058308]|uniref:ParB/RepB/Spo0J family partition protein n=1 Tax=Streptomyces sp. NPDC058308 TaxID=3346440 RepID=UPI0036E83DE9